MKNKILLTVIFVSLGFAIYALLSNLEKSKNQMYYYEGTSVTPTQSNKKVWNSSSSLSKKKFERRETASSEGGITSTTFNTRVREKNGILDTSIPEITFDQSPENFSRSKKNDLSINSDKGTSGIFLTQVKSGRKNNNYGNENASSFINSDYSSSIASTPSTFMGAPTVPSSPTDDIIIDPGGDPNPEDIIPIGEGQLILMVLALGYILFVAFKKRLA